MNVAELLYEDRPKQAQGVGARLAGAKIELAYDNRWPDLVRSESAPVWKKAVEKRISDLASYSKGWDGYQGAPPKTTILNFAISILGSTMKASSPAPSIVPMSGGAVQLEWHTAGYDIELAIFEPYSAELSVTYPDSREPIEDLPLGSNFSELGKALAALT